MIDEVPTGQELDFDQLEAPGSLGLGTLPPRCMPGKLPPPGLVTDGIAHGSCCLLYRGDYLIFISCII